ncbi:MFS transporter [Vibrio mediterranei]
MMIGIISGSLLSLFSLVTFKVKDQSVGLVFALFMFSISLVIMGVTSTVDLYLIVLLGVVLSIFIYRYAIGLYFTYSRSLQINGLIYQNKKSLLFSRIKLVNSLGGALGPLVGQYIINTYGYQYLFFITGTSFALCALIVIIMRVYITSPVLNIPMKPTSEREKQSFIDSLTTELIKNTNFRYLTLGAMLHFTFEAQLYTFISLSMAKAEIENSVGLIFSLNAVVLILLAISAGYFLNKNSTYAFSRHLIVFGSFMSCLSIVLASQATDITWLVIIVILFSIGEFITPQTCLDLITNVDKFVTQRLAIYNFFTSSLGMGIGFFIGGALFAQADTLLSTLVWGAILIGIATCFYASGHSEELSKVKE